MRYCPEVLHVSVVDHGRVAGLLRCLATLPAACADLPWRLTVIENLAGTDLAAVREVVSQAEIVVNPVPRGYGANHNTVLRRVLDDPAVRYAVVLNDDTELQPSALAALAAYAEAHPRVAAVAPAAVDAQGAVLPVLLHYPTPWREFLSSLARYPEPPDPRGDAPGWLNGACLLLRLEALRQVGLFDERFFLFYEDTDLCARLRAAGWEVAVCPGARILHDAHGTVADPAFGSAMEQQVARSQYLYLRKHFGPLRGETVRVATRAARGLRALKAAAAARRHPADPAAARHARLLRDLAAYDQRRPLPHEQP